MMKVESNMKVIWNEFAICCYMNFMNLRIVKCGDAFLRRQDGFEDYSQDPSCSVHQS